MKEKEKQLIKYHLNKVTFSTVINIYRTQIQKNSNLRLSTRINSMFSVILKTVCHDFAAFILDVLKTTYFTDFREYCNSFTNLIFSLLLRI